jgi:hypothetical protein
MEDVRGKPLFSPAWAVPRGVLVCGTLQEAYFARLGTCAKGLETRRVTARYISPSREISST